MTKLILENQARKSLTPEEEAIIKAHAFAQILSASTNNAGFAELVYCPLQLLENSNLLGHLPNNNPLIKAVTEAHKVKAVFTGPHGYISPRWHSEQMVPTWNYSTVSLTCNITFIENSDDKLQAMKKISHYFDPQWNFAEFNHQDNAKNVQQMLSAITVFTLEILDVQSKFKLSQNRSIECRTAFQKNLQLQGNIDLTNMQLM